MIDMDKVQADININDSADLRIIKEEIAILASKINFCKKNKSYDMLESYQAYLEKENKKKEKLESNNNDLGKRGK